VDELSKGLRQRRKRPARADHQSLHNNNHEAYRCGGSMPCAMRNRSSRTWLPGPTTLAISPALRRPPPNFRPPWGPQPKEFCGIALVFQPVHL